eukprot:gene3589-4517_t
MAQAGSLLSVRGPECEGTLIYGYGCEQATANGDGSGDGSSDFGFETLFPQPVQPVISRFGDASYQVFCMPAVPTHTQAAVPITPALLPSGSQASLNTPLEAPSPYDDERRKELSARGARLLEERLARKGSGMSLSSKSKKDLAKKEISVEASDIP